MLRTRFVLPAVLAVALGAWAAGAAHHEKAEAEEEAPVAAEIPALYRRTSWTALFSVRFGVAIGSSHR